ncbi:protein of unknown function [Pseudomonas sp. JV241A]|nr:protein of unknown function [Pseudomonas sp. JV241A]
MQPSQPLMCCLHRPHRRQAPDLWELALPAIERAAVAIQSTPDVLPAPASSPASHTGSVHAGPARTSPSADRSAP